MKRLITVILSFVIVLSSAVCAFASAPNSVYADPIQVKPGETVTIPVKIINNQGLMGFRITAAYDNTAMKISKVSRGQITSSGMFNDSITGKTQSSFDVLWSGTSDVKTDGVLFNMTFQIASDAKSGDYSINLSYTQNDTFNEKWQDVKLNVSSIKVSVTNTDSENPEEKPENNKNIFQKIADFLKKIIQYLNNFFS